MRRSGRLWLSILICGFCVVVIPREGVEVDGYMARAAPVADGTAFVARNRAQRLRIAFTPAGVRVQPQGGGQNGGREWLVWLAQAGFAGNLEPVAGATPIAEGNRVEYQRGALTEWYVNTPAGLEQGFTVAWPPSARDPASHDVHAPLVLLLHTDGMRARQDEAGDALLLSADDGSVTLRYGCLMAWDARGDSLPAVMRATDDGIRIEVDDRHAVYPLTIDPLIESAVLRASDREDGDLFGHGAAISGDTVIIGAHFEDGGPGNPITEAGAAYVFERHHGGNDNWGEVAKLTASDAQAFDWFGFSVAISGDTAVVGAIFEDGGPGDPYGLGGAAYVFERNHGGPNEWGEVTKLSRSDPGGADLFGSSVAISGDTAIVGARWKLSGPAADYAGAAYVFERNHGGAENWGEVAKLTASDAQESDYFGWGVAISGDIAVVGARGESGGPGNPINGAGAAYVFARDEGGLNKWGEVTKLTASDAVEMALFGEAVAVSGETVIVGATEAYSGPVDPAVRGGAAYVFERDAGGAGNWGEVRKLTAVDAHADADFGVSVGVSGDSAIVGGGGAYVFERYGGTGNQWSPVSKLKVTNASIGFRVAISGDSAIATALAGVGAAYVFERADWAVVLDLFGGLHVAGDNATPITPVPYFGFDIARDAEMTPLGAQVLDGFGGLFWAGDDHPLTPAPPYFGFDIARDLELTGYRGGYVLDGFGGVHALGTAPVLSPATPYFGFDVARDLELGGGGYYVLDGHGGMHLGGGAPAIPPAPPYFGFDIARDFELAPGGGGYVLDGFGGVHIMGGAPALVPATPYFGFDVARDLELGRTGGHYVLDGFGGLHAGGGAIPISPLPPYFGFDAARDLELR